MAKRHNMPRTQAQMMESSPRRRLVLKLSLMKPAEKRAQSRQMRSLYRPAASEWFVEASPVVCIVSKGLIVVI
jgi:hypothetical protein